MLMNKKTGDDDDDDENEGKAGHEKFEEITVKLCNLLILVGFSDLFFLKRGIFGWMLCIGCPWICFISEFFILFSSGQESIQYPGYANILVSLMDNLRDRQKNS